MEKLEIKNMFLLRTFWSDLEYIYIFPLGQNAFIFLWFTFSIFLPLQFYLVLLPTLLSLQKEKICIF